jgi:hypothetical protein
MGELEIGIGVAAGPVMPASGEAGGIDQQGEICREGDGDFVPAYWPTYGG